MIGKPIRINRYQSIKLVNWYRLVLVNRWSINNHTKIIHRLASIGTGPRNRHHARYLSDHPPFLGALGTKQFTPRLLSAKNIPWCTRTRITHLSDIAFLCHNVYAEALLNIRCLVKGYHLSCCCCWQFHCLHKYNFCYQNFSVKAQCNHFLFFFKSKGWPM